MTVKCFHSAQNRVLSIFLLCVCFLQICFSDLSKFLVIDSFTTNNIRNVTLSGRTGEFGAGNIALLPTNQIYIHGTTGSIAFSRDLSTTYGLPHLQNATIISDLTSRILYALVNDQLEYMNNDPSTLQFLLPVNLNSSTTLPTMNDWIELTEPIFLGYDSAIFSGLDNLIVVDGQTKTVYEIDLIVEIGKVTVLGECMIKWRTANGWLAFGISEVAYGVTSLVYTNSMGRIERQYLEANGRTEIVMKDAQYAKLSFSIDIPSSRWYFYSQSADMLSMTVGYADVSLILSSPTSQPSDQPTNVPSSSQPSSKPSVQPTGQPISMPSSLPSCQPTSQPTTTPSTQPTRHPTSQPTTHLSVQPTVQPSVQPSGQPICLPTFTPTNPYTAIPSLSPAAPKIISIVPQDITSTSVILSILLDSNCRNEGRVYCATFRTIQGNMSVSQISESEKRISDGYQSGQSKVILKTNGLIPITSYVVYCYTETSGGLQSTISNVIETKQIFITACCKQLMIINAPAYLFSDASHYQGVDNSWYSFTYTLSVLPSGNLTVIPFLNCTNQAEKKIVISPPAITFSNNQQQQQKTGSFILQTTDKFLSTSCHLYFNYSDDSRWEYAPVTNRSVVFISKSDTPPAPKLQVILLGDSGLDMYIVFDSATNFGGLSYGSTWPCTTLFHFPGARNTSCVWMNITSIRGTFTGMLNTGTFPIAGDDVTLLPNRLKASCQINSNCSLYPYAETHTKPILNAFHPIVPTAVLRIPLVLGGCDDLLIDPTGSFGNGGREWSAVRWTVTGSGNVLNLKRVLTSYGNQTKDLIIIPRSSLSTGIYTFSLTIQNVFEESSTVSASVHVSENFDIPQVKLFVGGDNMTSLLASQKLEVQSQATFSSCTKNQTEKRILYDWTLFVASDMTVFQDTKRSSSLSSAIKSKNPSTFLKLPFSLPAGKLYILQLQVIVLSQGRSIASTSTATKVFVIHGSLIAAVNGGNYRQVAMNKMLTLNASISYDEDTGTNSGLVYTWECMKTNMISYGVSCNSLFLSTSTTSTTTSFNTTAVRMRGSDMSITESYTVIMMISSEDGRSASTQIMVQPIAANSPYTSILATSVVFNVGSNLTLNAVVRSNVSLVVTWDSLINGQPISITAYSPLNQSLPASMMSTNAMLYSAMIRTDGFVGGSMVTFRVSATALDSFSSTSSAASSSSHRQLGNTEEPKSASSAYSQIYVSANAPPKLGSVTVTPSSGTALSTSFAVLSSGWVDDLSSYPFTYSFAYVLSPKSPKLTLSDRTMVNTITASLPAGLTGYKNQVTIRNTVYDTYSASTTVTTLVTVNTNTNVNVLQYLSENFVSALQSGNPSLALQIVNNAASTVNSINCSLSNAEYCAQFHREPCAITPQTCGSCVSGYIGIIGASNTPCFSSNTTTGRVGSTCASDEECIYGQCVHQHCEYPIALCESSIPNIPCSGHGTCHYFDVRNIEQVSCSIDNIYCAPQCVCVEGYGGSDCSLDPTAARIRDQSRAGLCQSISSVKNYSDPTNSLLDSLSSALFVSYSPVEVFNAASIATCENSVNALSKMSAKGYLKGSDIDDEYGSTAEKLVQTVSKYVKPADSSNSQDASSQDGTFISSQVAGITFGIFQSLQNGQYPAAIVSENIRINASKTLVSNLVNATLSPPKTLQGHAYEASSSRFELIGHAAQTCNSGNGYAHFAIMEWGINPYRNASQVGSPLLRFSKKHPTLRSMGEKTSNAVMDILFHMEEETAEEDVSPAVNITQTAVGSSMLVGSMMDSVVNTMAIPAYYITIQFVTKQQFNTSLTVTEMRASGKNYTFPDCTIYNGEAYVSCGSCNVSTYTNYNVTFVCHDMSQLCPSSSSISSNSRINTAHIQNMYSLDTTGTTNQWFEEEEDEDDDDDEAFLALELTPFETYITTLHDQSKQETRHFQRWLQSNDTSSLNSTDDQSVSAYDDDGGAGDDAVTVGGGMSIQQYGAMFAAMGTAFASVMSSNPFAISLEEAKTVLSLIGCLLLTTFGGCIYFYDWDESDRNQLIYSSQWPPKKDITFKKLLRKLRPKKLKKVDIDCTNEYIVPSPQTPLMMNPSVPLDGQKVTLTSKMQHLAQEMKQQQTEMKRKLKAQKNMFFTSNISDFFDLVTPDIFQFSDIASFFYLVVTQHDYTTMFCRPSTAQSRYIRWIGLCKSVLLALFIDTLFFQVFFSNTGACEAYTNKTLCTTEMNSITGDTKCIWTGSGNHDGKGTCELNPPPSSIIFTMILALTCVLIALPIDMVLSFIIEEYCTKRPVMEAIGWSTDYWLGRGTTSIDVPVPENEARDIIISNLQINFRQAEEHLLRHSSQEEYGKYKALLKSMDNNNVMVWHEYSSIEEEVEEILHQVLLHYEQLSSVHVHYLTDLQMIAWKEAFHARTECVIDRIGVNPNGQFRSLTFLERFKFDSVYDKLIGKVEDVRDKMAEINEEMELIASVNKQLQEVILLHNFVLEHFTPFKAWILQTQLNCFEGFLRPSIHPYTYFAAWLVVYGALFFFLYWMFAWSAANGSKLIEVWGVNYSIGAIQDMFFVQIGKLIIMYLICIYSIKPQLQSIRYHLHGLAISAMQGHVPLRKYVMKIQSNHNSKEEKKKCSNDDEGRKTYPNEENNSAKNTTENHDFNLIQHLSPTCRLAWKAEYFDLVMSKLLRQIDEYDMKKCAEGRNTSYGAIAFLIIFVPVLLFLAGEATADLAFEIVFPTVASGFILINALLYGISILFLVMPYIIIAGMIGWYVGFYRIPIAQIQEYYEAMDSSMGQNSDAKVMKLVKMFTTSSTSRMHLEGFRVHLYDTWNEFVYRQHTYPQRVDVHTFWYGLYTFYSLLLGIYRYVCFLIYYPLNMINEWLNPYYYTMLMHYESTRQETIWLNMNKPFTCQGKRNAVVRLTLDTNTTTNTTSLSHITTTGDIPSLLTEDTFAYDYFTSSQEQEMKETTWTGFQENPLHKRSSTKSTIPPVIRNRENKNNLSKDIRPEIMYDTVMQLPDEIRGLSIFPWISYDHHWQALVADEAEETAAETWQHFDIKYGITMKSQTIVQEEARLVQRMAQEEAKEDEAEQGTQRQLMIPSQSQSASSRESVIPPRHHHQSITEHHNVEYQAVAFGTSIAYANTNKRLSHPVKIPSLPSELSTLLSQQDVANPKNISFSRRKQSLAITYTKMHTHIETIRDALLYMLTIYLQREFPQRKDYHDLAIMFLEHSTSYPITLRVSDYVWMLQEVWNVYSPQHLSLSDHERESILHEFYEFVILHTGHYEAPSTDIAVEEEVQEEVVTSPVPTTHISPVEVEEKVEDVEEQLFTTSRIRSDSLESNTSTLSSLTFTTKVSLGTSSFFAGTVTSAPPMYFPPLAMVPTNTSTNQPSHTPTTLIGSSPSPKGIRTLSSSQRNPGNLPSTLPTAATMQHTTSHHAMRILPPPATIQYMNNPMLSPSSPVHTSQTMKEEVHTPTTPPATPTALPTTPIRSRNKQKRLLPTLSAMLRSRPKMSSTRQMARQPHYTLSFEEFHTWFTRVMDIYTRQGTRGGGSPVTVLSSSTWIPSITTTTLPPPPPTPPPPLLLSTSSMLSITSLTPSTHIAPVSYPSNASMTPLPLQSPPQPQPLSTSSVTTGSSQRNIASQGSFYSFFSS